MSDSKFSYSYPHPAAAADVVLFGVDREGLQVLLVRRKHRPFARRLALPGGFLNEYEPPAEAALRELTEETGAHDVTLLPFANFGAHGRDPRGWILGLAHLGVVRSTDIELCAGDDAGTAAWHSLRSLPRLAFDHNDIVRAATAALGSLRPAFPADGALPTQRPRLLLVAGLTASGKSTLCRALADALPEIVYIDTDQLRRDLTRNHPLFGEQEAWMVHNIARALAEWMLTAGHDVIVDATGLTSADRSHYLSAARLFGAQAVLVWCETPEGLAARRIIERKNWTRASLRARSGIEFRIHSLSRLERPRLDEAEQVELATPETTGQVRDRLIAQLRVPYASITDVAV